MCCREGGTLQTNITGMCGECLQCLGHTGFAPTHGVCAFLVYAAQAPGCSAGERSKVGPGLRALPRSKPLRFRFSCTPQRHRLRWVCIFCPSQVWAAQEIRCLVSAQSPGGQCILSPALSRPFGFPGCTAGAPFQLCCVSPLGSWSMVATLLANVNRQDPRKTWLATGSLLTIEDAVSGPEFAPCLPLLAVARLPPCLWWGMGWSSAG